MYESSALSSAEYNNKTELWYCPSYT